MQHTPVLLNESLGYLNAEKGKRFIDATAGSGGHTIALLKKNPRASVLAIDRDQQAAERLRARLIKEGLQNHCTVVVDNYSAILQIAKDHDFQPVSGIIMDLGFSSEQLDDPTRGFSFQNKSPLDMRFDGNQTLTADEIVNHYPEIKLAKIFYEYGEEKFGKKIAHEIALERSKHRIENTVELFQIIKQSLPKPHQYKAANSARRVFQALRIGVNDELNHLRQALPQTVELLESRGRLVVISFHSLEDRIVKHFLREKKEETKLTILTRKPVLPTESEILDNPRSSSGKLRAAEKI